MRERLTEAVGKPHLSYSSLKYSTTCCYSNQKNSKMSTTLLMMLASSTLLAALILGLPNDTGNGKRKQRKLRRTQTKSWQVRRTSKKRMR